MSSVSHVLWDTTVPQNVMGYMAKHSHRQQKTFLTAQKIKRLMCLSLHKMHLLVPVLKILLGREACFKRAYSNAQRVINRLNEN